MSGINLGSALDEIQYRLMKLNKLLPSLKGKRIVVYGTGINAERVLDCMCSLDVLGLMDQEYTGKYIYGKKVLSQEEIVLLGIDTILIAAEPQSAQMIYFRILPFCMDHHISILDMYGCDEIQMHQNILEQEMAYVNLREEEIKSIISNNDALVISFKNVLCSEIISDEDKLYEKVADVLEHSGIIIPNFKRNRIKAQKRAHFGNSIGLNEIYNILSTIVAVGDEQLKRAKEIEEALALENLVPRIKMIELLKYAINLKKDIYIFSDMAAGERVLFDFMQRHNVYQYQSILSDKNTLTRLLGRTINALGAKYGYDRVLYIGNAVSDDMIVPQLYNINFQLIQNSCDMFFSATSLPVDRKLIESVLNRDEIIRDILQAYNTPFFNQIDKIKFDDIITEKIGWIEEEGKSDVKFLPIKSWNSLNDITKLVFHKEENPVVSIIISAYNQFEYTYNCLSSVLLNTDNVPYEVIVADNCSHDFTSKLDDIVSGVTVLHNESNLVFINNCNNAAKKAKGKYLVFLNNNTQVQLNWLFPLVKCMESGINVGLVGSKLVCPDGRLQEAGCIIWNNAKCCNYGNGKNPDSPAYSYVREVDYISGAAIMITKDLWNDIGGFDKRYAPAYYEDADLAFEVRKRGKRVLYQPDSVVVQFENIEKGIKKYQEENLDKFFKKWNKELLEQQYPEGKNILAACERKQKRKTVLFVSEHVPTYNRDAGSRTLDFYIQEFINRGYIVKFIPANFVGEEPYTCRLEQMGVEVFRGKYYKKVMVNWICSNHDDIDFVFLNYPNASIKYIDLFKKLDIPVMYYGVDLHYLRLQREYELFGNESVAKAAKSFYDKEAYLIKNSDVVYYPSMVEAEIVRKEFHRNDVKQLMINIYEMNNMHNAYRPDKREGIMFIGGYNHTPNVDAVLWFSHHIFPQIYDQLKLSFYIVGADMPIDISNIDVEGIEKLGALTDKELEEMYQKVKMIVVPLRYGAGIKGKVIEAMYHGVPTVTTSIGMEGIPNENDAVRIADNEDDFAKAVIELYQSDKKLMDMSVAGQEIIKRYYSREVAWNNIAENFTK